MDTTYKRVALGAISQQMREIDLKITQYFDCFGKWAEVSVEVRDLRARRLELELQFVRIQIEPSDE